MGVLNLKPVPCAVCGITIQGWHMRKFRVADGFVCGNCASDAISWLGSETDFSALKVLTAVAVGDYAQKEQEKRNRKINFPADIVAGRMKINTKTRKWCWTDPLKAMSRNVPDFDTRWDIFDFDDVGEVYPSSGPLTIGGDTTITNNGVGRAVVGGLLAGSTGAVVGAATAKQTVHSSPQTMIVSNVLLMQLKPYPGDLFHFGFPSSKDLQTVMDVLAPEKKWQANSEQPPSQLPAPDPAEELRKYKALADEGVITAQDYEAKKKQLLGL